MSAALPVLDARRVPADAVLAYDVCIVGTGAAGVTAALGLAGRGWRIAVLESGGLHPDEATNELLDLDCPLDRVALESRERWLGGTTNAWTGGKTTLDDIDLAVRPWVPHSGWPIDSALLRRCYSRAATLLDRPPPSFYDAAGEAADGIRFDNADLRTLVFHEDAEPLRFGEMLRQRLAPCDGVDLITLANVTEVHLDEAGRRVDGVAVATLAGNRFRVNARAVVLACGAIENARLLLASRSRRSAGLGNGQDLVGRYYQDHPKGFTAIVAVDPRAARLPASPYWGGQPAAGGAVRWGIGLTEQAQERAGVLNSYVRLEPVVLDQVPAGIGALRRAARGRVRGLQPRQLAAVVSERSELARLARFRLRNQGPIDCINVRSFLEQEPRPQNRVRLGDRRDRFGVPLPAVDWALSELDRHSVRVLHQVLAAEVRARGLGSLQAELDDGAPAWAELIDASHHAGTTRMGTDPRTSVTDPGGQVHEVPGLFMAGPSLFPTSGYANPVFTIAATALHVADHVAAEIGAPPVAVAVTARTTRPTVAGRDEVKRWVSSRRRSRSLRPPASRALAVVWTAPGVAELVPSEVTDPGEGEISVLVEASAVSPGTERARWLGSAGAAVRFPHRPGYSLSGTVIRCGPGVHDLEPGAPVAVWGAPHQSVVTVHRRQAHALPDHADHAEASLITLGAIAALGVARAGPVDGRSVAVIGAGPIGLLAQRLAATGGASSSTVVAASTAKDAVARGNGTVCVRPPAEVDAIAAEVVIEATGAAGGLELALRAARPGATVVLLGTTRAHAVTLPLDLVQDRQLRLVGAHGGLLDLPGGIDGVDRRAAADAFLRHWSDGSMALGDLITHRVDPRDVAGLYALLAEDRTMVVPVLEWWRLPAAMRASPGAQLLPNPVRRGVQRGGRAGPPERPSPAVVDHPAPPPLAAHRPQGGPVSDEQLARAAVCALHRWAPDRPVRVDGAGPLAACVRARLEARSVPPGDDAASVVIDTAPSRDSVQHVLDSLGPDGYLFVVGSAPAIELDVQQLIHHRGTTLVGVAPEYP